MSSVNSTYSKCCIYHILMVEVLHNTYVCNRQKSSHIKWQECSQIYKRQHTTHQEHSRFLQSQPNNASPRVLQAYSDVFQVNYKPYHTHSYILPDSNKSTVHLRHEICNPLASYHSFCLDLLPFSMYQISGLSTKYLNVLEFSCIYHNMKLEGLEKFVELYRGW
jgi:hypothetical protein